MLGQMCDNNSLNRGCVSRLLELDYFTTLFTIERIHSVYQKSYVKLLLPTLNEYKVYITSSLRLHHYSLGYRYQRKSNPSYGVETDKEVYESHYNSWLLVCSAGYFL